jgi:hypothetical protein
LEEVMRVSFARSLAFALLVPLFAASNARAEAPGDRQPYLIDPLLKEFTEEAGT